MERILVCLDDSPRAALVLSTAVDLARRMGAKLRLLRVIGLPPEIPTELYAQPSMDLTAVLVKNATVGLQKMSKDVPPELFDGVHTCIGVPWDGICAAAREQDADLIVIGAHGYHGLDHLLGTTAAKVVNHADRPVLVVRPRGAKVIKH